MPDGSRSFNFPASARPRPRHCTAPASDANSPPVALFPMFALRPILCYGCTTRGAATPGPTAQIKRLVGSSLSRLFAKVPTFSIVAGSNKRIHCYFSSLFSLLLRPFLDMRWQVSNSGFSPELRGNHAGTFVDILNFAPSGDLVERSSCLIDTGEYCLVDITNWSGRSTLSWPRIRGSLQNPVAHLNIRDYRAQWRSKRLRQAIQVRKNETAATGIKRVHLLKSYLKQAMRCRIFLQQFQASAQINALTREIRCSNESLRLSCFGSSPSVEDPRQEAYSQRNDRSCGCCNRAPINNTRTTQWITSYPSGPIHVQLTSPCAVSTFCHAVQRAVTEHG